MVLLGANTYTGTTTTTSGSKLQIGNGGTTGSLATGSAITDNGALIFNRSNTVTQGTDFANVISGSGTVTQNGTGKLTLASNNTFTGGVTLNAGTLGTYEGTSLGAIPGAASTQLTFGGNSTLQFQATPAITMSTGSL